MVRYIIRRLLWMVVLLFLVSALTFVVFYLLPSGDPVLLRAGHQPTPRLLHHIRVELGLDRSRPVQFWLYMKALVLHGDLGTSYEYRTPVRSLIADRLPTTVQLAVG